MQLDFSILWTEVSNWINWNFQTNENNNIGSTTETDSIIQWHPTLGENFAHIVPVHVLGFLDKTFTLWDFVDVLPCP